MISIIVPVYMAEKTLCRCVESIIHQSFSDFEVVLVDDGSTDKSGGLCDSYAKHDSRIKVIHKENGGVSSARNTGILASSGVYLTFCDSDDYLELDYLEGLYQTAKKHPGGGLTKRAGGDKVPPYCCDDATFARHRFKRVSGRWKLTAGSAQRSPFRAGLPKPE